MFGLLTWGSFAFFLYTKTKLKAKDSLIKRRCLGLTPMRCDPPEVMNKLDELFPRVEDFPSHHIGPRKIEAKIMLQELGYNVRSFFMINSNCYSLSESQITQKMIIIDFLI